MSVIRIAPNCPPIIMNALRISPLVASNWLKQQIMSETTIATKKGAKLRILDTSWMPEPMIDGYKEFYKKHHIPTAVFMDLKRISPKRPDSPIDCPIPDERSFKEYVQCLGINNDTHVIAYDSLNCRPSVRAWYLFRLFGHDKVSILDGGMSKWISEGNEVVQDEYKVPPENFEVNFRPELLLDFRKMKDAVKNGTIQLVDSRPKTNGFYITNEDKSGGHMPGAVSMPFPTFFKEDGTFKSESELKAIFDKNGVDPQKPMIATCQRGMTACAVAVASSILDKSANVPVYNGSWFEWSLFANPDMIVRKKEIE